VALVAFGAAGLIDFWRWTYSYGHDLDVAHAIIKIPGTVYQPPILGTKQILNFTATSWPASGAWFAAAAFVVGAAALATARRATRRTPHVPNAPNAEVGALGHRQALARTHG
jgi:copper chaperone NosL